MCNRHNWHVVCFPSPHYSIDFASHSLVGTIGELHKIVGEGYIYVYDG
jgi:hypothetical protein